MQNTKEQQSRETWETIAEGFNATRQKPWERVVALINSFSSNSVCADFGCGNGRHILPLAQKCKLVVGYDFSWNLLTIAQEKTRKQQANNVYFMQGTLTALPFKNNSLDHFICIAALHNIEGREHRIHALKEMYRVLRPNGVGLITVWSRWQDRFLKTMMKHRFTPQKEKEFGDIIVPWRLQNKTLPRFYHLYGRREFKQDLHAADFYLESLEKKHLTSSKLADNFFALVHKKYHR